MNSASVVTIQGPEKIEAFGREVYLTDYIDNKHTLPPELQGGVFSHLGVFDLDEVDPNNSMWFNDGIREDESDINDRSNQFNKSFETIGWSTKFIPPLILMTENGFRPSDGRGRVITSYHKYKKGLTSRYIPVYFYDEVDSSETAKVIDGLSENLRHEPSFPATRESVVVGCLYLVEQGELEVEEASIRHFLNNKLKIYKRFDPANITKIVTSTLERAEEGGGSLVTIRKREIHEDYCNLIGFKIDSQGTWLISMDNETYAYRTWCEYLLQKTIIRSKKGIVTDPARIVLYTNSHVPSKARKNLKNYMKCLNEFHEATYMILSKAYDIPFNKDKYNPIEILGCIPQIVNDHDKYRDMKKLVPIDQY